MVLTFVGATGTYRMAQQASWTKKDLTGIEELSRAEIEFLFQQADGFLPALAPGKGLDLPEQAAAAGGTGKGGGPGITAHIPLLDLRRRVRQIRSRQES